MRKEGLGMGAISWEDAAGAKPSRIVNLIGFWLLFQTFPRILQQARDQ